MEEMRRTEGVRDVYKGRFFQSPGLAPTFQVSCATLLPRTPPPPPPLERSFVFPGPEPKNGFLAGLHGTCGRSEIQAPGAVWEQRSGGKDFAQLTQMYFG